MSHSGEDDVPLVPNPFFEEVPEEHLARASWTTCVAMPWLGAEHITALESRAGVVLARHFLRSTKNYGKK
eukprot:6843873-Pyramimonas_sp.AAC.1